MMRKLFGRLAVVAVLMSLPAVVQTLPAQGIRWGAGAGLQLPLSDYADQDKLGWVAGAAGTYWLGGGKVGIRGDLSYGQTAHDTLGGNTKIIGGMASLVYPLGSSAASTRPYLMGGLGFYNVDVSVTGFGSASESKLGFGAGAGVSLTLGTSGKRLYAETRFTTVSTSGASTTFLPIVVGISFGK